MWCKHSQTFCFIVSTNFFSVDAHTLCQLLGHFAEPTSTGFTHVCILHPTSHFMNFVFSFFQDIFFFNVDHFFKVFLEFAIVLLLFCVWGFWPRDRQALISLLALVTMSCPTLVTPWTVACQAPLSMGFSRQAY